MSESHDDIDTAMLMVDGVAQNQRLTRLEATQSATSAELRTLRMAVLKLLIASIVLSVMVLALYVVLVVR